MSQKILIVKNIAHEGSGLLETILRKREIHYEIVDLDQGENFPSVKDYQALVVLGGPDSANDKTEKMKNELEKVKEVLNLKIPYLGICLGMQGWLKQQGRVAEYRL